ncbi:MAG: response regulator [Psychrobacter celer]
MQQFQSLQRLLLFYVLTLLVMLVLYYVMLFDGMRQYQQQHSVDTFFTLQHELTEHAVLRNDELKGVLAHPALNGISYQLIFMLPSGQTYIHRDTRPNEPEFSTVTFPTVRASAQNNGAYTLNARNLAGTIELDSGHRIYMILRHKPLDIDWTSYKYWLPLMAAIALFITALLYMLKRRTNWEQLLRYTDNLSDNAKEAYTPPPFLESQSTGEFLRLGHALGRINYQLHNDYRRIKTLKHRLERLIEQAPLPMAMIMRHGQISFFNQRFEQVFIRPAHSSGSEQLTDFVAGKDDPTQQLLQRLVNLRVTRTLTVLGIKDQQTYQLHVTPWFGEHGQVHGFTVFINNINELTNQTEQLRLKNQQLQQKIDEFSELRSIMGHKLRLPLESLIDTLEPIDPSTLTDKQNHTLETLIKTSHYMLTTLNDMLDIGDIEVRKTRLSIAPVDIYKLGQEVGDTAVDHARQQGLELIYFFDPECPRVIDTDRTRLRQILLNLFHNAIKFTPSGYVALAIDAISPEQVSQINKGSLLPINEQVKAQQTHYWVRFSIKDSGTGIDIAKQHQLLSYFNKQSPSFQQHNNLTYYHGIEAGLGLNNVNSFARLLGGFIELKSAVNKGSTFNLYLPCRQPSYQPIYHPHQHLQHIHLIAVVNQTLLADYLRHLCHCLSIPATIYTDVDSTTIEHLAERLGKDAQSLAPILLLDYEYYTDHTAINLSDPVAEQSDKLSAETSINESKTAPKSPAPKTQATKERLILASNDRRQALHDLLSKKSLPKILCSMKPERRIPSALLDQCDGFLLKPLESALLLSELTRLTLPVRQTLTTQTPKNNMTMAAPLHKDDVEPLILVVEDSPTNQKIACKILSKLGYRSIVAEDGQQALEQLKAQREDISLILMDCRMPVMDGLQATQAIRAQGDDIAIVALTANSSDEDRDACIQVGMDEFLSKPINKKKLEAVLKHLIKH